MIEKIEIYLLIAFFFLLFLAAVTLFERYRERIHQLLEKLPWTTNAIIEIFCVWAGILFLRKLTYYIPLSGIIQTKDALLWVGHRNGIMIFCAIGAYASSIALIKTAASKFSKSANDSIYNFSSFAFLWTFLLIGSIVGMILGKSTAEKILHMVTVTPLLLLKMLCSGKYLGLLTGLVLACYIIYKHEIIKRGMIGSRIKFFIVPALIIIGILISGYYKFRGNWEEKFADKVQAARSIREFEDLLDAVGTIENLGDKYDALKRIVPAIAKTGNIKWASSVAETIPNDEIKNDALKEIRKIK